MDINKTKKKIKKFTLNKSIKQEQTQRRKYLRKPHSLPAQSLLLKQINSTSQHIIIQLFFGASIYQDGIVRQVTALDHVSLGWMQGKITQIEQSWVNGGSLNIEQTPKNMSILEIQAADMDIAEEIQRNHPNIDLTEIIFNTRQQGIRSILKNDQGIRGNYEFQDNLSKDRVGQKYYQEHLPVQLDAAVQFLNKGSGFLNHKLAEQIAHFFSLFQKEESIFLPSMKISLQHFQKLKNEQFLRFINESFKYLKTLSKDSMYSYVIGRVHPITYELESFHFGYSQAYLDLLGIDVGTLSQLFLRKKTIELVTDPQDITRLSANIINWMVDSKECQFKDISSGIDPREALNEIICKSTPISIRITTFDGFQLTLHQQQHLIPTPGEIINKEGNSSACPCEYFLKIFDFDVELSELESLIAYRQRLTKKNGKLSIDDLIKKELSFLFEDVEYSVFSQEFLEKYYAESLPSLMQQKQMMLDKQQDKLRCKFKDIKLN